MHARKLILAVALGGPFLGTLMGLAADPDIVAPPEPFWRQVTPDPIFTESRRPAQAAPVFAVGTTADRVPSWKRRGAEPRSVAPPPAEPRAPQAEAPEPVALTLRPAASPLDQAAEDRDAAQAAASRAGADTAPQPAAVDAVPAITS